MGPCGPKNLKLNYTLQLAFFFFSLHINGSMIHWAECYWIGTVIDWNWVWKLLWGHFVLPHGNYGIDNYGMMRFGSQQQLPTVVGPLSAEPTGYPLSFFVSSFFKMVRWPRWTEIWTNFVLGVGLPVQIRIILRILYVNRIEILNYCWSSWSFLDKITNSWHG